MPLRGKIIYLQLKKWQQHNTRIVAELPMAEQLIFPRRSSKLIWSHGPELESISLSLACWSFKCPTFQILRVIVSVHPVAVACLTTCKRKFNQRQRSLFSTGGAWKRESGAQVCREDIGSSSLREFWNLETRKGCFQHSPWDIYCRKVSHRFCLRL